ncbi:MAG: hypothetical protein FWC67_04530, partial [Defluviitaleaceae bacterium]|nr:hypothetical protein [Defluviitaleaceae bacterium]
MMPHANQIIAALVGGVALIIVTAIIVAIAKKIEDFKLRKYTEEQAIALYNQVVLRFRNTLEPLLYNNLRDVDLVVLSKYVDELKQLIEDNINIRPVVPYMLRKRVNYLQNDIKSFRADKKALKEVNFVFAWFSHDYIKFVRKVHKTLGIREQYYPYPGCSEKRMYKYAHTDAK